MSTTVAFTADADPTILARICALLCTLGLIPERFAASRNDNVLRISIELTCRTDRDLDLLRRKIRQLPQYIDVTLERERDQRPH